MKAQTVREARCFLAGCLKGDAWITKTRESYLCMRVVDYEFAFEFSRCIELGFKLNSSVTVDERSYYLVRRYNKQKMFDCLLDMEPETKREKQMWLRGVFDSEGSVEAKLNNRTGQWTRRVAMFSTNMKTLKRVQSYLRELKISVRGIQKWSMTKGHIGTKQVYAVVLNSSKENFEAFQCNVGFTIFRHQINVITLCVSYDVRNKSDVLREGQAKAAKTRREKFFNVILPEILAALKQYLSDGGSPTMRDCSKHVPKYGSALHYFKHFELLEKVK